MYVIDQTNSKALTLKEYAELMYSKGEIVSTDGTIEVTTNAKGEHFLIDETGTACKVEYPYVIKKSTGENECCEEIKSTLYLGTSCPHCGKPFRQNTLKP